MKKKLGANHPDTLASVIHVGSALPERAKEDLRFRIERQKDDKTFHKMRLLEGITMLQNAVKSFQERVPEDHPRLLEWKRILAQLLVQSDQLRQLWPLCIC